MKKYRKFCSEWFQEICAFTIMLTYLSFVWIQVWTEIRRSLFQRAGYEYIIWGIAFSGSYPVRTCNDTNPVITFTRLDPQDSGMSIGCANRVLSPAVVPMYILGTFCPILFRLKYRTALALAILMTLILAVGLMVVGTRSYIAISAVAFQLAAGLISAHFCAVQSAASYTQFMQVKGTREASKRSKDVLHTILPRNVAERLDSLPGGGAGGMVGAAVPACAVMFCTLDKAGRMQDAFSERVFALLDGLFADFDAAVERFGMYKYQHVGARPRPCPPPLTAACERSRR